MTWFGISAPAPSKPTTFEDVVLPHLDRAHNLARWLVRDPSLAEDVTQDAMLRALNYFGGFRGDDARAWLFQIVRNAAYAALASRKKRGETAFEDEDAGIDLPDLADDPEAALVKLQDLKLLDQALAALPIELRECLVLRELEGCSYKEIARVTDMPIGTVMSRLWRARQILMGLSKGSES